MGDKRSYAALDWVVGEIGESLNQARQALEAWVETPDDMTRIRFCLTHIHQVHGSLQMVEFYGAALLAEEMENLAQALMNQSVRSDTEAQEVLMRAILQLPVYLDQVKHSKNDSPSAVLPLLNDLRAVRGEALLTETKLFAPDLAPAHQVADDSTAGAIDPAQFGVIVQKLRQMYQYAAAGVIRNVNAQENMGYLYKVFGRLRKLTRGTARQPLWDISLALLEGLEQEAIEPSATVKNLLRQLDKEIETLKIDGVEALNNFTNDELIKNLLYYVARATGEGKHIQRIRRDYNLQAALPEAETAGGEEKVVAPDREAVRSVVSAIKDELKTIKHALDVSLTGREDVAVSEALPVIKQVADTMAVLGIGDLRKQILAQGEALEQVADQGEVPADTLMQVAGKIIEIEGALDIMASGANQSGASTAESLNLNALDQAQETVLRESRNGLEQAKDAIIEYITSQWDRRHLGNVPDQLAGIAGSLDMVPLQKPAAILNACGSYIQEQLLDKDAEPEWQPLESLADAIASVEYYIERLLSDRDEEDELLLNVAEESVQSLGYPVGEVASAPAAERHADAQADTVLKKIADVEEVELSAPPATDTVPDPAETPDEIIESGDVTPAASEQPAASADDDDMIDDEILEIFIEEAGEVIGTINEFFPQWAENFENQEALTEFRRAFHTLKGSGRMVGANDIGELSWAVENMLNRVIDDTVEASDSHVALIEQVVPLLPPMVEAFKNRAPLPDPEQVEKLSGWAEQLSRGEIPAELDSEQAPAEPSPTETSLAETQEEDDGPDLVLFEIFSSEAVTHLDDIKAYIAAMEEAAPLYTPPSDQMQRALHTLKGSAHMADVKPIAELATPLERFVKELKNYQVSIDADVLQLIKDAVEYTELVLQQIANRDAIEIPRLAQFLARVAELKERSVAPLIRQKEAEENAKQTTLDPELLSVFMAGEMKLLLDADEMIQQWQSSSAVNPDDLPPLVHELEALERGSEHAKLPPMATLCRQLCDVYQALEQQRISVNDRLFDNLLQGHSELLAMVDAVAIGDDVEPVKESTLTALADLINRSDDVVSSIPTFGETETADTDSDIEINASTKDASIDADEPVPQEAVAELDDSHDKEEVDLEVFEIFLEEADELLEELDEAINEWENNPDDNTQAESLKRTLHTLKGGARMAGLTGLGDLSHNFETFIIGKGDNFSPDDTFFATVHDYQDKLITGSEKVKARVAGHTPDGLDEVLAAAVSEAKESETQESGAGSVTSETAADQDDKDNVLPFAPKAKPAAPAPGESGLPSPAGGDFTQAPASAPGGANPATARKQAPQEMIKVSAELMEELVNLAGETSISRGRLEEQSSEVNFAVDEMESTVHRLQEQLRRLDIETEAQMIFRQEQMEEAEEFDPLEMDRYSQLQQLSRSLMESASDLMDITSTLHDKNRGTETLLLQQSRINTDLQEGLMRSRMVPFSRLVPRLRRIVRQVSTELGKHVSFELDNVEGEMDRSVLERMVAPLEHMLRNAVDHGIESTEDRIKAGKPETGRIVLSLGREGGDVVMHLADDGCGLNLDRIKAKAIERGLMTKNAQLSDHDIMQFILHAGFSTADKVTQISGRGVGMDVVHAEIKQLGGSVFIDSRWGEGTEFTIRLPFTVSVNRALMIQIGDDNYAIPLNTIEGIVRVSPFELEHYYQDENARFEYASEHYRVRYLGTMLSPDNLPRLEGQSLPIPVVLVRTSEHTMALQVDKLLGSREIVVKSLGPQFSAVEGLSGATVMGDGSVVVILDPHAMIRKEMALVDGGAQPLELPPQQPVEEEKSIQTVLVVDDSVTVRKVTTRFLEREGYEVMTAKDGADALLTLQDHIPDVMLLDIEMPRMDGFEVAKNIRSSSRLKHIPIIMITSRTGEKHRERALGLGVNRYLGKPYQEEVLLENIQQLLEETEAAK